MGSPGLFESEFEVNKQEILIYDSPKANALGHKSFVRHGQIGLSMPWNNSVFNVMEQIGFKM